MLVSANMISNLRKGKSLTLENLSTQVKSDLPSWSVSMFSDNITMSDVSRVLCINDKGITDIFEEILNLDYKSIDKFDFLSGLYEEAFSLKASFYGTRVSFRYCNKWRAETGSYYTPQDATDFIISRVCAKGGIGLNDKVLDPCCGAGNLLLGHVRKLSKKYKMSDVVKSFKNLYGFETNKTALKILRMSLWVLSKSYGTRTKPIEANLYNIDFLDSGRILPKNIKFDKCFANPPYIKADAKSIRKFKSLGLESRGSFRMSDNISELCFRYLRSSGVACLILPSTISVSDKYIGFRKFLLGLPASIDVVSFDNIPTPLFTQKKYGSILSSDDKSAISVRSSLFFVKMSSRRGKIKTTSMIRHKLGERKYLFSPKYLGLTSVPRRLISKINYKIPFIGSSKDMKLFDIIDKYKTVGDYLSPVAVPGVQPITVTTFGRYFLYASIGDSLSTSKTFKLYPKDKHSMYNIYCYLNSNLFFWYWRKVTIALNLTRKTVVNAPMPLLSLDTAKLMAAKLKKKEKKCIINRSGRVSVNFNKAYPTLHEIDLSLLRSMGSTRLFATMKRSKSNNLKATEYPWPSK
jgi:hypothetical protein